MANINVSKVRGMPSILLEAFRIAGRNVATCTILVTGSTFSRKISQRRMICFGGGWRGDLEVEWEEWSIYSKSVSSSSSDSLSPLEEFSRASSGS